MNRANTSIWATHWFIRMNFLQWISLRYRLFRIWWESWKTSFWLVTLPSMTSAALAIHFCRYVPVNISLFFNGRTIRFITLLFIKLYSISNVHFCRWKSFGFWEYWATTIQMHQKRWMIFWRRLRQTQRQAKMLATPYSMKPCCPSWIFGKSYTQNPLFPQTIYWKFRSFYAILARKVVYGF